MARCKLTPSSVKTHQQINIVRTRCPGMKFPANSFLESLKSPAAEKGGRSVAGFPMALTTARRGCEDCHGNTA